MDFMRRLLIADASEEMRETLYIAFQKKYEIALCGDGGTALKLLMSFQPDVLILDLLLPVMDGITVLREIGDNRPSVILTTSTCPTDYVELTLIDLGVGYSILKPCSASAIVTHITEMEQRAQASEAHCAGSIARTAGHLQHLGIQTHLDGYQQLRVGIPLFAQDPAQNICKELYVHVATICGNDSGVQVERSMRSAIKSAWMHRDKEVWAGYFPSNPDGAMRCPSNKTFISRLAELLA